MTCRLLVDADTGAQAINGVDVGLIHNAKELPRVAAQALHIAALSLSVDRVKDEARLTTTTQACHHHKLIAWNGHADIFEVILARPNNPYLLRHIVLL